MQAGIPRPSQAQLRGWKKLTLEKYRRQERAFLAEGEKIVGELLKSERPVNGILICGEIAGGLYPDIFAGIPDGTPVYGLTKREWGTLSQDKSPEGVMAIAAVPGSLPADGTAAESHLAEVLEKVPGPLLLLYQVSNPNNLGALFRTACWFGFSTIILSRNSCEVFNPKVVRASMGSIFQLNIIEGADFEEVIANISGRFSIVGSDVRQGVAPHPCGRKTALLLGSESHGLPEALLNLTNEAWKISGAGEGESLSLPQAGAIMMYECARGNFDQKTN
ncbi:MAG: RNA methyltransferase [Syntrophales bacterium]|jgi:TrmH family RNA methyltransferase|nr:RNA methyltransferase [Syntrophales bacterium]